MHPDTFADILGHRLGEHFRLRWSEATQKWMIERKIARAIDAPGSDDEAVRIRDGYALVLAFRPSPWMSCDVCGSRVALPAFEIAEVACDYCAARGERSFWFEGYFPLCDRTLEWLERGKPTRAKERAAEIDLHNARLARAKDRATSNIIEAIGKDHWNRVSQTLQVGYTAPGSPHQWGRD